MGGDGGDRDGDRGCVRQGWGKGVGEVCGGVEEIGQGSGLDRDKER